MTGFQIAALVAFLLFDLLVLGIAASLLLGPNFNAVLGYYFILCFIWLIAEGFLFARFGGPIKRGVMVWREDLPRDSVSFFRALSSDVKRDNGFMRTDGKAVIILTRPPFWRTSWPYVAYIDLLRRRLRIEYRVPLPSLLILLPFFMNPLGFMFVAGMLIANHFVEKKAIANFIAASMRDNW
ncbi:hypothetical protein ANAEL_04118 [Anaerolineales bacterium]|nr:hypothetical protein ANAEL_04118 [Anaerolineales bacterium]